MVTRAWSVQVGCGWLLVVLTALAVLALCVLVLLPR
jgi:hypothetical protein